MQGELKLLTDNLIGISNIDLKDRPIREVLDEKFRPNRWTELKFKTILREIGAPADLAVTRDAYALFTKVQEGLGTIQKKLEDIQNRLKKTIQLAVRK